jgi:hypothetical protein
MGLEIGLTILFKPKNLSGLLAKIQNLKCDELKPAVIGGDEKGSKKGKQ